MRTTIHRLSKRRGSRPDEGTIVPVKPRSCVTRRKHSQDRDGGEAITKDGSIRSYRDALVGKPKDTKTRKSRLEKVTSVRSSFYSRHLWHTEPDWRSERNGNVRAELRPARTVMPVNTDKMTMSIGNNKQILIVTNKPVPFRRPYRSILSILCIPLIPTGSHTTSCLKRHR